MRLQCRVRVARQLPVLRPAGIVASGLLTSLCAVLALAAPGTGHAAKTLTLSAASTTIIEGDSGRTDVTITLVLGEGTSHTIDFRLDVVAASSTATDNTNGSTSCSSPSSNADICYPFWPASKWLEIAFGSRGSSTIGILGDTDDEGDETLALKAVPGPVAEASGWHQSSNTLILTIKNDDAVPGVTVSSSELTVNEGDTGSYTVVLNTQPSSTVTVSPASSDADAAAVSPASLSFTTSDWDEAQTVTVTGEQDLDSSNEDVTVTHAVTGYGSVSSAPSVAVTVADDERTCSTLQAPTNLSLTPGSDRFAVSWTAPTDAARDGWSLSYRKKGETVWSDSIDIADAAATGYTLTGLDASTEYEIRLLSTRTDPTCPPDSLPATVTGTTTAAPVPAAPAGLSATAGDTQAVLLWTGPSAPITSYKLAYAKTADRGSAAFAAMTGSSGTTTTHTVTGLENNAEYSFRIRAVNASGDGAATGWVTATPTPPAAPVLTAAVPKANGIVGLAWTHGGTGLSDLVTGARSFWSWEVANRLKGRTTWSTYTDPANWAGANRRGLDHSLGRYPAGASLEIRIRAVGSHPNAVDFVHGPWSNILTVIIRNAATAALTITGAPVTVAAGSTATYTVALTNAYAGTLSITSSAAARATVRPASLTYTAGDYSTGQAVTVTGVAAGTATINHAFRLTGASADAIPDAGTVSVTVNAAGGNSGGGDSGGGDSGGGDSGGGNSGGGNSGGGNSGGGESGGGNPGGGGPGGGSPGGGSGNNDGGNGGSDGDSDDGGDDGDNDDGGGDDGDSGPGGRPKAAFTLSASCADGLCRARTGASVSFTDTSTGTVTSRTWSFGDGGAGSGSRSLRHAWSAPGFYTVSLTVSGEGSSSTMSRKVLVEAGDPAGSCTVNGDTRCLRESRFSVAVEWWTADGEARKAGRVVHEGTDDSGLFWFFSEANWELLLKVLDGCSLNGHVWVFGASATTLGYSIQVTDTVTGAMKEYRNEPGRRSSAITDTAAFPGSCTGAGAGASASASTPPAGGDPVAADGAVAALLPAVTVPSAAETGSCTPAAGTLCLQDGRYAVSVDWTNREGETGKGSVAPPRADDSGLFWFFSEANWELLVKVLDACTSNRHHWVFAASATDVGFDLQVRDTVTGQVRRYTHTAGAPARALADVTAFPDACTP